MLGKRFTRALVVTTTASLILAAAALADTIGGDADFVTGGNQTSVNVSGVSGSPFSQDVRLSIAYSGGQHVAVGTAVTFTGGLNGACASTVPATTPSGNITIPSGWASGSVAGPLAATITGTIGGSGSYSCNYRYTASVGTPQLTPNFINFTINFTVTTAPSDTTPPVITPNVAGTLGNNGWYTSDVTVTWSVVDDESAISSSTGCGATTISTDTTGTTLTCSATSAGGTASQSVTIERDATAPTVGPDSVTNTVWRNTDLSVDFTASDATSGLAVAGDAGFSLTASDESADASTPTVVSRDVYDKAGNKTTRFVSALIDKTSPVVTVTGVSDGATYTLGSAPVAGCDTSDALSGVATAASLSTSGGPVGSVTATCSGAVDNAANTGSASVTYTVVYDFAGFFQPVENLPAWNKAKAGQSIPVKFSLNGDQGLGILAAGYPKTVQIACPNSTATVDPIEEYTTTANSKLIYDALEDQYNYVWKTDKLLAGKCVRLEVRLVDGTTHSANFQLTK